MCYYICVSECVSMNVFPRMCFQFAFSTNTDSNITQWKDQENDHNSSLLLKTSLNLELLVNQFNNATAKPKNCFI